MEIVSHWAPPQPLSLLGASTFYAAFRLAPVESRHALWKAGALRAFCATANFGDNKAPARLSPTCRRKKQFFMWMNASVSAMSIYFYIIYKSTDQTARTKSWMDLSKGQINGLTVIQRSNYICRTELSLSCFVFNYFS